MCLSIFFYPVGNAIHLTPWYISIHVLASMCVCVCVCVRFFVFVSPFDIEPDENAETVINVYGGKERFKTQTHSTHGAEEFRINKILSILVFSLRMSVALDSLLLLIFVVFCCYYCCFIVHNNNPSYFHIEWMILTMLSLQLRLSVMRWFYIHFQS